jgi:hypothetical protein
MGPGYPGFSANAIAPGAILPFPWIFQKSGFIIQESMVGPEFSRRTSPELSAPR